MSLADIKKFSKSKMQFDPTGHDYLHAERVAKTALKLYQADYPNQKNGEYIVLVASYLHDTIDEKVADDVKKRQAEVQDLLNHEDIDKKTKEDILYIINHLSYSKNLKKHYTLSTEGQYVQDADRLDAIGAIGIARAFAYGGHKNREIYNPDIPVVTLENHDQYRNHKSSTINHFYEKLLKLANLMNTPAAKKEAQRRTKFMQEFLDEFDEECDLNAKK